MHAYTKIETLDTASQARTCRLPDVSVAEARARLVAGLRAHGFSVVSEVDLADLVNRRLDTTMESYRLVEGCHPKLAQLALAVSADAGLVVPFRFGVWKDGADAVVATLPSSTLAWALGREHLADFVKQAEQHLGAVFASLDRPAAVEPPAENPVLDDAERAALKEAATRHLQCLLAEAAGTESHDLQHDLAQVMERLERATRKL